MTILSTAGRPVTKVVSVRFRYNGQSRIVDNIDYDSKNHHIIGFEMRKSGKFSYKIKRFDVFKVEDGLTFITPPRRTGPKVGRPTV